MAIVAIQHVRRMRGGAQGHLMRCDDGHYYVVNSLNNPQHLRVLANEFLATRLAEKAGLPVPITEVVEVGEWLVKHTTELNIQLAHQTIPCLAGLQFGSRYVVSPPYEGQVFDYLPTEMLDRVRNLETFAGMLAMDKWTCNSNGRQAAFWRKGREKKYTATFIDQGYCFNAGEWSFPDYPLRGVYARNEVRWSDASWGQASDRNLAGRFTTRMFTLPRLGRVEDYYVRQYDGSSPAKYSRYSAALHLDYPL